MKELEKNELLRVKGGDAGPADPVEIQTITKEIDKATPLLH